MTGIRANWENPLTALPLAFHSHTYHQSSGKEWVMKFPREKEGKKKKMERFSSRLREEEGEKERSPQLSREREGGMGRAETRFESRNLISLRTLHGVWSSTTEPAYSYSGTSL